MLKMNVITLLLYLFVHVQPSFSQEIELPVDESGRYTYHEVVDVKNFDSVTLLNNAENFLKGYINKKQKKTLHRDDLKGEVTAMSSFQVFKKGSLGKNVDGAIEYSLRIEVKDQKYRYTLTDFYFQEYERNRYGKFEPINGKVKPLETPSSKLNDWQWNDHKKTVQEKMTVLVSQMKVDMMKIKSGDKKKVKVKEDW